MRAVGITLALLAVLSGCGASGDVVAGASDVNNWQRASAGWVGCRPRDVSITESEANLGWADWIASCQGRQYVCSAVGQSIHCTTLGAVP